jgi:hypothetical protein
LRDLNRCLLLLISPRLSLLLLSIRCRLMTTIIFLCCPYVLILLIFIFIVHSSVILRTTIRCSVGCRLLLMIIGSAVVRDSAWTSLLWVEIHPSCSSSLVIVTALLRLSLRTLFETSISIILEIWLLLSFLLLGVALIRLRWRVNSVKNYFIDLLYGLTLWAHAIGDEGSPKIRVLVRLLNFLFTATRWSRSSDRPSTYPLHILSRVSIIHIVRRSLIMISSSLSKSLLCSLHAWLMLAVHTALQKLKIASGYLQLLLRVRHVVVCRAISSRPELLLSRTWLIIRLLRISPWGKVASIIMIAILATAATTSTSWSCHIIILQRVASTYIIVLVARSWRLLPLLLHLRIIIVLLSSSALSVLLLASIAIGPWKGRLLLICLITSSLIITEAQWCRGWHVIRRRSRVVVWLWHSTTSAPRIAWFLRKAATTGWHQPTTTRSSSPSIIVPAAIALWFVHELFPDIL